MGANDHDHEDDVDAQDDVDTDTDVDETEDEADTSTNSDADDDVDDDADDADDDTSEDSNKDESKGNSKKSTDTADDKDTEDDDDGEEPELRKPKTGATNAEWAAWRKQQKAKDDAKKSGDDDTSKDDDKSDDEDDDGLDPDDAKAIDKRIQKHMEPFRQQAAQQEVDGEIATFLQNNPDFKSFEAKARRFALHPSRANIPIKSIFYEVAGDKLMKIGADRAKAAAQKAKKTRTAGGDTGGDGKGSKSYSEMPLKDFGKELEAAKMRR